MTLSIEEMLADCKEVDQASANMVLTPVDWLPEKLSRHVKALIAENERLRQETGVLEAQLACCCELANAWAREHGVEECAHPFHGLRLRSLVDRLWVRASLKEELWRKGIERLNQQLGE